MDSSTSRNETTLTSSTQKNTAFLLYQEELLNGSILSYNANLDEILKDLIVPGTITEFTGYPGSGKTQVCFQLCISVQFPKSYGGFGGEALYINTNRNFALQRIKEFAGDFLERFDKLGAKTHSNVEFNEKSILKHIHVLNIDTAMEILACLVNLQVYLIGKNVRLIVIDSISYPLRLLSVNTRIEVINKIFSELRSLAAKNNFAIVMTNDLTTRVDEGIALVKPSFGDSFYHLVNSRIHFSKIRSTFQAKIVKSILHDQKEVHFHIP
ncbi:hypothetical protein JTB14_000359 [Gonioctena quinquepunctata]|nr:hypothetical protein JTB14_000359 [Gonioctena quinquepunctata]